MLAFRVCFNALILFSFSANALPLNQFCTRALGQLADPSRLLKDKFDLWGWRFLGHLWPMSVSARKAYNPEWNSMDDAYLADYPALQGQVRLVNKGLGERSMEFEGTEHRYWRSRDFEVSGFVSAHFLVEDTGATQVVLHTPALESVWGPAVKRVQDLLKGHHLEGRVEETVIPRDGIGYLLNDTGRGAPGPLRTDLRQIYWIQGLNLGSAEAKNFLKELLSPENNSVSSNLGPPKVSDSKNVPSQI